MESTKWEAWIKSISYWILVIVLAILLAFTLRLFFFASFKVPTPSMEPAIVSGDFVLVNKMIPGARIFKNFDFLSDNSVPDLWRVKGIRKVRRNDVLVFNFPYSEWGKMAMDMNTYYVKRCVGIPGDTFYIEDGVYKVTGWDVPLGNYENQLKLSRLDQQDFDSGLWNCFPYDKENFQWTMKNFGPFYIPRAGERISLDTLSVKLYKNLIEYETGSKMKVGSGKVYLADSVLEHYEFKQNYYFMAGDYIFDSQDSRYWGLLPEDHIVGKASLIWKSEDPYTAKKRWERFFMKVK